MGACCVAPRAHPGLLPVSVVPFHSRYLLEKKLGQGAFSNVYAATSIAHGGDVAVKVTDLRTNTRGKVVDAAIESETEEAVRNEVEVLKYVRDEQHCIQFLQEYREGVLSYIVTERCEFSLCQAFESMSELNERTLVHFVRGMLRALMGIHSLLVVHRDIKPDNFLCTGKDMQVKLCDFGLAKILPSATCSSLSGVYGTAPFMSPEMLSKTGYGAATDVWSVGVIVYVMIFARFPYEPDKRTAKAMKLAILSGSPVPSYTLPVKKDRAQKPDVSKEVTLFMRRLLDRNPVFRPSAKQALQMLWISLPDAANVRSARCLQPTFQAAKRIGAFHPKAHAPRDDQPDGVDVMLSQLRAKHGRRKNSKDTTISTYSTKELSVMGDSQVSTAAESSGASPRNHASKTCRHASNVRRMATPWAVAPGTIAAFAPVGADSVMTTCSSSKGSKSSSGGKGGGGGGDGGRGGGSNISSCS
mmetsp:Transcript_67542/g.130506  ORF Transcript_67542/g.130506 Transcript_67542/m.130506 type:complete len:471 (+) Transcript_67542:55-1467(+)